MIERIFLIERRADGGGLAGLEPDAQLMIVHLLIFARPKD